MNQVSDKSSEATDYTLRTKEFAERNAIKAGSVLQRLNEHGHYFGITPLKLANGRLLWPNVQVTK